MSPAGPRHFRRVQLHWIFRIKRDSENSQVPRAFGHTRLHTQLYGIGFQETFAPVARLSCIRAIIALAASEDWGLHPRPDITYAVTALSQYLQNPGRAHQEQVERVIRYLKGTRNHELKFGSSGGVEGFTDANWGNDIDDRHSICGYVFTLTRARSPGHLKGTVSLMVRRPGCSIRTLLPSPGQPLGLMIDGGVRPLLSNHLG